MFVPIFIIPGLHGRDASYSQNGEIENKTVQMAVMYYVNNNIVIADAKTKKVYLTLNLDTNILVADANGWTKNYNLASLIAI